MRNYLTALASGWRAGKKQARKRLTELQRDDAAKRLLREVNKWDGVIASKPGAITHAESVAELNEIRAIMHPPVPSPRFPNVTCSHCGGAFGPGDHGFSHCENHAHLMRLTDRQEMLIEREVAAKQALDTQPAVMPIRGPQDAAS